MKLKIEINDDEADKMLCKTLKALYKSIYSDYKSEVLGNKRDFIPIFSTDTNEEKEKLKEFLKALALVHNYHCIPSKGITFEDISHS